MLPLGTTTAAPRGTYGRTASTEVSLTGSRSDPQNRPRDRKRDSPRRALLSHGLLIGALGSAHRSSGRL
jgi:hypothetical protein